MTESDVLRRFDGLSLDVPVIELAREPVTGRQGDGQVRCRVKWGRRVERFAIVVLTRGTDKAFDEALGKAQRSTSKYPPLMLAPFLNESQLSCLVKKRLSGIDLSGNAVIMVPNELFVFRTGRSPRKDEFFRSSPLKNVYRGKSSIVGRVFLCKPAIATPSDVVEEIRRRDAKVSIATVSKVLKQLDEDLIISRKGATIRLIQPEKLLEKLVDSYEPVASDEPKFEGKCSLSLETLMQEAMTFTEKGGRIALSGVSSTNRYAIMAREDMIVINCSPFERLFQRLKPSLTAAARFPNLQLFETDDDLAYFDVRREGVVRWASPVQTYLELMTGDKRERETAEQVKGVILAEARGVVGGG